jgi:hypothetical protein
MTGDDDDAGFSDEVNVGLPDKTIGEFFICSACAAAVGRLIDRLPDVRGRQISPM